MGLREYVIRRMLIFIPSFFFTTILIFSLIHLAPGDPIDIMFSARPVSRELADEIRRSLGLDQPVYIQYLQWINRLLHGDLGFSYLTGKKVVEFIGERLWNTVELMILGMTLSISLAIILGVTSAVKHRSLIDNIVSVAGLFGYSMPNFWLALMLVFIFALWLGWFPVFGTHTIGGGLSGFSAFMDHLRYLVLPVISISAFYTGYLARIVRTSMLEVLRQDYITTARAKGVKEYIIIYKHAFRNALLPFVTVIGITLRNLVGGAVVVETIFAWPGLGKLAVDMALQRDFPTLMGLSTTLIFMVLLSNLITDISYALIDPRIKY